MDSIERFQREMNHFDFHNIAASVERFNKARFLREFRSFTHI